MLVQTDLTPLEGRGRYRDRQGGGRVLDQREALEAVLKGHEVYPHDRDTADYLAERLGNGNEVRAEMIRSWSQTEFGGDRDARSMDGNQGLNAVPPDDRDPGLPTSSFPNRPQPGISRREPDEPGAAPPAAKDAQDPDKARAEPVTERTENRPLDIGRRDEEFSPNKMAKPDIKVDESQRPKQDAAGDDAARAKALVEQAGDDQGKLTDLARRAGLSPKPNTSAETLKSNILTAVSMNVAKGQPALKE